MENSIAFEVLTDLPFNIKKGNIVEYNKSTKKTTHDGTEIPFDVFKEKKFFKEIIPNKYKSGDKVIFKAKLYDVLKYTRPHRAIRDKVEIRSQNKVKVLVVDDSELTLASEYWFINSSGKIYSTYDGLDTQADSYRVKSNNYYTSKEHAREILHSILLS